jgi:integrase
MNVDEKSQKLLSEANTRLQARVKVSIECREESGSLYLRAIEDPKSSVSLLAQLLSLWDQYAAFKAESLSQTTIGKDFRRIRNYIQDLDNQKLDNAIAIQDYLQSRVTPNTARRILVQLNACCNWTIKRSLLSLNPFAGIARTTKVVKEDEIDPFPREEMVSIIQGFKNDPYYSHYLNFSHFD